MIMKVLNHRNSVGHNIWYFDGSNQNARFCQFLSLRSNGDIGRISKKTGKACDIQIHAYLHYP